ncbi:hypothetical protein [Marixanthomonas spongiae]|uniref:hypothetical protein n=1 Tax=Marixanthomonas spongiae TaxID=2174845 RepID=UPI001401CE0B|nr:hypothetical protein [Marixanthomonas spongiae]
MDKIRAVAIVLWLASFVGFARESPERSILKAMGFNQVETGLPAKQVKAQTVLEVL